MKNTPWIPVRNLTPKMMALEEALQAIDHEKLLRETFQAARPALAAHQECLRRSREAAFTTVIM